MGISLVKSSQVNLSLSKHLHKTVSHKMSQVSTQVNILAFTLSCAGCWEKENTQAEHREPLSTFP